MEVDSQNRPQVDSADYRHTIAQDEIYLDRFEIERTMIRGTMTGEGETTMSNRQNAKILIVDDEISNVQLLEGMLTREGYTAYKSLTDPRLVVPTYKDWQPDLILLDIMMPHMDGFAVMEALKDIVSTDDFIPILVLTADLSMQTKKRTLSSGAMDFVTKPFDIVEVMLRIRNLLQARALHQQLQNQNIILEEKVRERTATLREINSKLELVLSSSPLPILGADAGGRITNWNKAAERLFGWTEKEAIGKVCPTVPPEEMEDYLQMIRRAMQGEASAGLVRYRRKASGSIITCSIHAASQRNSVGEPMGVTITLEDMTERGRAEEALRKSEEQFRLISENVADMIAVLDPEGKRIYNSPSYKPILGDPESLRGTDSFQEIHPEDRERIRQTFRETVKTGTGWRADYRFILRDGSIRFIESQGSAVRDDQGNVSQVIVVSRDITEKKKLEQQYLRAQRMESIGTLAGGIAHDLNNVLAPILLSLGVIRSKVADEQSQKMLQMLESTAKRGADLIKQVLSFARGVEGERTIVQIRHLIDEIGKIIQETFPKSISLRTNLPKNLPTISGDATQLHQVLMNLCVNARDAMPNGGTIEIKAESIMLDEQYARMHVEAKLGAHVVITVTDQGMGIPPAIMEKIFEPFFTTKEIGKGTGLGLSTVLTIIKSHDGFVNVYSEIGKGTTFKIYLPAQQGAQAAVAEEKEELPTGNGELILVVDDEESIREITRATLEAYGYSVITASDGTEAVAAYVTQGQKVALVLTDTMMPYMDGTATIRAIQRLNPKARFVSVSGLKQTADIVQQESVVFLHKPYTSEKLLKIINEMLHRR